MASLLLTIFAGSNLGANPVDARECVRLLTDYVKSPESQQYDLRLLPLLLREKIDARVLVRIELQRESKFVFHNLGLAPRADVTVAAPFTFVHQHRAFAIVAGKADAVVAQVQALGQMYANTQVSVQILQATALKDENAWSIGKKLIALDGFGAGDILAGLDHAENRAATLYDVDLLTANFSVPTEDIASISDEDLKMLGIDLIDDFNRRAFQNHSLATHRGSYTIFSQRAFRRLNNFKNGLARSTSVVSPELAAALDQCVGPMCTAMTPPPSLAEPTEPVVAPPAARPAALELVDAAPSAEADETLPSETVATNEEPAIEMPSIDYEIPADEKWISTLGRKAKARDILTAIKDWSDRRVAANLVKPGEELKATYSKGFALAAFTQIWDHVLSDWIMPENFGFADSTANSAWYKSDSKGARDVEEAWEDFFEGWEDHHADKAALLLEEARAARVAEVEAQIKAAQDAAEAEAQRKADEAAKKAAEAKAAADAKAAEDRAEAARLAAEEQAEAARVAAAAQAAAEAEAQRKADEAAKKAAEAKAAADAKAAEDRAEAERLAAEEQAEAARVAAAEQAAAETAAREAEEQRRIESERVAAAEEARLAEERRAREESESQANAAEPPAEELEIIGAEDLAAHFQSVLDAPKQEEAIHVEDLEDPVVSISTQNRVFEFIQTTLQLEEKLKTEDFKDSMVEIFKAVASEVPYELYKRALHTLNEIDWNDKRGLPLAQAAARDAHMQDDLRHAWSAFNILLELPAPAAQLTGAQISETVRHYGYLLMAVQERVIRLPYPKPKLRLPLEVQQEVPAAFGLDTDRYAEMMKNWHGYIFTGPEAVRGTMWTILFSPNKRAKTTAEGQAYLASIEQGQVTRIDASEQAVKRFYNLVSEASQLRDIEIGAGFAIRGDVKVTIVLQAWKQVQFNFLRGLSPSDIVGILRRSKSVGARPSSEELIKVIDPLTNLAWDITIDKQIQGRYVLKNIFPSARK